MSETEVHGALETDLGKPLALSTDFVPSSKRPSLEPFCFIDRKFLQQLLVKGAVAFIRRIGDVDGPLLDRREKFSGR